MKKILLTTLGLCVMGAFAAFVASFATIGVALEQPVKPTPIKWEYVGRVKKVDYKVRTWEPTITIIETESIVIAVPILISNIKINKKFYYGSRGNDRYIYQESDEKSLKINRDTL